MDKVKGWLQRLHAMEISILLSVVMLSGAVLDIISPKGALGSSLQVVRPLEVVSLSEGASLCAGLRGIQPGFIRQRLAALVRGRPWAPAGGGLEGAAAAPQGGCEDGWVLGLAGHALAVMACLGGIACLLCALLLPRRQLAQLAPGKWLYWAWLCACSAWLARKAAQRKAAAALSLRAALRSGAQQFDLLHWDKDALGVALDEAEAAKVDVPLVRRAGVALRELRRKAARGAKKGNSGGSSGRPGRDPGTRRSQSPGRSQRRKSRSASRGRSSERSATGSASELHEQPPQAVGGVPAQQEPLIQQEQQQPQCWQDEALSPTRSAHSSTDARGGGGNAERRGRCEEQQPPPPLLGADLLAPASSAPSMSLSLQSSLSGGSSSAALAPDLAGGGAAASPMPGPPHGGQQQGHGHGHHGEKRRAKGGEAGGKPPQLVRDSVGELEAVAAAVAAYEREKERQREEKRQKRRGGGGGGAEEAAAQPPPVPEPQPAQPPQSSGARCVSRAAAFFGRKATPVGAPGQQQAAGNAAADRVDRKLKPVAVPIEPSTPRGQQAARKPAVLVVPRRFVPAASGGMRKSADVAAGGKNKQPAPTSPTVNGWKGNSGGAAARHASASAPVTPNGKAAAAHGGGGSQEPLLLPLGQAQAASQVLGPPEPAPPERPAVPLRLYAQVAREAGGLLAAQQERPSTAPPAGQRSSSGGSGGGGSDAAASAQSSALSASSPAFVPMAHQAAAAASAAAAQQLPMPAMLPGTPVRALPGAAQASFLGLGGFSFSTLGSAHQQPPPAQAPQQALQQPPAGASPGSLSPFPGMSVNRRALAPALRGIGQVGGNAHELGLPGYAPQNGVAAAMAAPAPAQPVASAYPSFDSIWSSAGGEPLPVGTSPPGWSPMGAQCRTSKAPQWGGVPSPLQHASSLAADAASGPHGSHLSSLSTTSSLDTW